MKKNQYEKTTHKNPITTHGDETLTTSEVGQLIGISVTVKFLEECGNVPAIYGGVGTYWRKVDLKIIAESVIKKLQSNLHNIELAIKK